MQDKIVIKAREVRHWGYRRKEVRQDKREIEERGQSK